MIECNPASRVSKRKGEKIMEVFNQRIMKKFERQGWSEWDGAVEDEDDGLERVLGTLAGM
jgi:hypothetical protein